MNQEHIFRVSDALIPSARYWTWQDNGLCKSDGVDATVFFNDEKLRGHQKEARESAAKKVCTACPVKTECLEHALAVPEYYGVWGGLTEHERMGIVKFKQSIETAEITGEQADDPSSVYSL